MPGYAETLERRAEQMERLAVTGMGILERVQVRATHHPSQERYGITPEDYGMCLVAELLAEGWTPPEELRVG